MTTEPSDYHIQLSSYYLLEEAACFALLVKRGFQVFIYPGTLTIFQELAEGRFPDAPDELKQLITVNIRQNRR